MTIEQERLTPTQEDREAAADAYASLCWAGDDVDDSEHAIRCGKEDGAPFVQAFARHRLAALESPPIGGEAFQSRVQPWLLTCFGAEIAADREERNHRFLEEALELVQSCGCTASEAHQLVDYVYGREIGEPAQEVGGVMVTLAALCLANDLDMHATGETELARVWGKVEAIRAKQAAKPKHSPLPIQPPTSGDVGKLCERIAVFIEKAGFTRLFADEITDPDPDGVQEVGWRIHDMPDEPNAGGVPMAFWLAGGMEEYQAKLIVEAVNGLPTILTLLTQMEARTAALEAENAAAGRNVYRLQKVGTDLAEALRQCGDQFAFYAREHTAAGKLEKAATNQRFADLASSALLTGAGS